MTLVAMGSVHGSPGVTTLGLLLTRAMAAENSYLVEADAAGGVVAARYGLGRQPGLATLVARSRHGQVPTGLDEDAQSAGGVSVLVAPESPERLEALLGSSVDALVEAWAGSPSVLVFADVGRVAHGSAAARLVAGADLMLWMLRPELGALQVLRARIQEVSARQTQLVLLSEKPYDANRVKKFLGRSVLGVVPDDRRSAEALTEGRFGQRAPLARAVRSLADRLHDELSAPVSGPTVSEWAAEIDRAKHSSPASTNGSERHLQQEAP